MGLTAERLKLKGGLTAQRLSAATPKPEEPGFFQGLVQSAAQPFLKLQSSISQLATDVPALIAGEKPQEVTPRK